MGPSGAPGIGGGTGAPGVPPADISIGRRSSARIDVSRDVRNSRFASGIAFAIARSPRIDFRISADVLVVLPPTAIRGAAYLRPCSLTVRVTGCFGFGVSPYLPVEVWPFFMTGALELV
jgi:hypothetical protein